MSNPIPVAISGSGLHTPPKSLSNEELVALLNEHVERFNAEHADAIARGEVEPKQPSSAEFILKASGIRSRHVVDRDGILDPDRMRPRIERRGNDDTSQQAEIGILAAREALERAGRKPGDVDGVLVANAITQRSFPAISVEIQDRLGCGGYAFDMTVACASASFGVQLAVDAIRNGSARRLLVISPEICTGLLDFGSRDSHFIFGDAATALLVEPLEDAQGQGAFEILGTRLRTKFSNNIRSNFGYLNYCEVPEREPADRYFTQEGRKVFKEVVPWVSEMLLGHLSDLGIDPARLKRLWLHQANVGMNSMIARKVLGRDATPEEAPIILDEYANTSSAGSVIAFHKHHEDLVAGDLGVLSGFGAGYSAGSVVLKRH